MQISAIGYVCRTLSMHLQMIRWELHADILYCTTQHVVIFGFCLGAAMFGAWFLFSAHCCTDFFSRISYIHDEWRSFVPLWELSITRQLILWIRVSAQLNAVGSYWSAYLRHSRLQMRARSCDVQLPTDSLWLPGLSPTIWEGGRDRATTITSSKDQKNHVLQESEYNSDGNMKNRHQQHLTRRIHNYPIVSSDESLTDQLSITLSTWHVSSAEVLARSLVDTCAARPQATDYLTIRQPEERSCQPKFQISFSFSVCGHLMVQIYV